MFTKTELAKSIRLAVSLGALSAASFSTLTTAQETPAAEEAPAETPAEEEKSEEG